MDTVQQPIEALVANKDTDDVENPDMNPDPIEAVQGEQGNIYFFVILFAQATEFPLKRSS